MSSFLPWISRSPTQSDSINCAIRDPPDGFFYSGNRERPAVFSVWAEEYAWSEIYEKGVFAT
jgi:hypothetical protein